MFLKSLHGVAKIAVAATLLLALFLTFASHADAQSTDDGWADPVNLSRSGSATDPYVVTDASGTIHVLWRDTVAESYVYIHGGPGDWSEPVPIEPPFGTRQYFPALTETDPAPLFSPTLIATADGRIHSFWIDNEDALRHSWVSSDEFTSFSAWSPRIKVAESASDLSVATDKNDQLFMTYIGSPAADTQSAGVNFLRFDAVEGNWSTPIPIYESAYLRQLAPDQANVQMKATTIGDTSQVYVVWDNRSLERLFFARSEDGGASWTDPLIVDQREANDEPDTTGPTNITLTADASAVLLVWQAGHDAGACSQYYQRSSDGGRTWSNPSIMLEELDGCPQQSQLFEGSGGSRVTLFTVHEGQPFLSVWDGERWSEPQPQEVLKSFVSSEIYRSITLDCLQLSLLDGNQILALGCGKGPSEQTDDIWQTVRALGEIDSWFAPPPEWSPPVLVSESAGTATLPEIVTDDQGRVHALWSQPLESNVSRTAIYYAQWNGERWSSPQPTLALPSGSIVQLELAVSNDGRLIAVWLSETGEIIFRQVDIDRVTSAEDWSAPIVLPSLNSKVGHADLALEGDGTIIVAFSIPVNENRGIYLTRSEDMGESWQEPILVFDGIDAGWDVVGEPDVVVSGDDVLHLLWAKQILLADGVTAQALYYTRSVDQGETFDEPQIVAEAPVGWFGLVRGGATAVHRFWQEQTAPSTIIRHDYSVDGGRNWSDPLLLSTSPGPVSITADSSGQLHVVQADNERISYLTWDGGGWHFGEGAELLLAGDMGTGLPEGINAVVSLDRTLVALFASDMNATEDAQIKSGFFATLRDIEVSDSFSVPAPTLTEVAPTPTPEQTAELTFAPSVTATTRPRLTTTVDVVNNPEVNNQETNNTLNNSNDSLGFAVAFVPVGLFLIAVFSIGLFIRRAFHKRN